MVLTFQSREVGFGIEISDAMMKLINKRRARKHYFDKVAAQFFHNTTYKYPLIESPFVCFLEFWGSNGYWCDNHIVVQTEYVMDFLAVIFEGRYGFVFLSDHSSGHTKKRGGGLDVTEMNKDWGGGIIGPTRVKDKIYLGLYHDPENPHMVKVREEQTLVCESDSDFQHGYFHIATEKIEATRNTYEVALADKKVWPKYKSKSELVEELILTAYGTSEGRNVLSNKLVRYLQKMEGDLVIYTKKMLIHRTSNGWENQDKGFLQFIYERGWIDESGISKYKVHVLDEYR